MKSCNNCYYCRLLLGVETCTAMPISYTEKPVPIPISVLDKYVCIYYKSNNNKSSSKNRVLG